MKLLKITRRAAIVIPNIIGAFNIERKLIPEARMAFISLSSDNRPNVIRVDNNTAIGTDKAIIQARFKNRYSKIVRISNPLPRNRSIARSRKFIKRRKVIINNEKKKGIIISRIKYLEIRSIFKITNNVIIFMNQIENCLGLNFFKTVKNYFKFRRFKSTYVELKLYGGCSSAG